MLTVFKDIFLGPKLLVLTKNSHFVSLMTKIFGSIQILQLPNCPPVLEKTRPEKNELITDNLLQMIYNYNYATSIYKQRLFTKLLKLPSTWLQLEMKFLVKQSDNMTKCYREVFFSLLSGPVLFTAVIVAVS
jgi:hypothetical protein